MSDINYLTEDQIEEQEHLNVKRLSLLKPKYGRPGDTGVSVVSGRPEQNLIDLMHWVKHNFGSELETKEKELVNLHPWIHNKIVMDGSFLQFCEEEGVKIECLYRDSVASWKADKKFEHFMALGVFKISYKKFSFLHAALFHKGNQNEDEVSFFIVVNDNKYEDYINFRNQFDNWIQKRDRENLEIHVVGGEGQPYERDMSWDDIFLPEELKTDIVNTVEGFLKSKEFYAKKKIPWKRGLLFYGLPGCHAAGHPILMYNGTLKNVEDIVVGDKLMGPDGTSREVLKLARGNEEMYEVFPKLGKSFVVNKNHILHLKTNVNGLRSVNITVEDFMNASACLKERSKLRYSDVVEFERSSTDNFIIDPYFLGVWLGDGTSSGPSVTTMDPEIKSVLEDEARGRGLYLNVTKKTSSKCSTYYFSSGLLMKNSLTNDLKKLNVLNNKHIPPQYLTASVKDRLALLAGIIDTDGGLSNVIWRPSEKYKKKSSSHFQVLQKNERLSNEIVFLSRSLGFRTSIKKVTKTIKSTGFSGSYYRINISGDLRRVPTILPRKKAVVNYPNKDKLCTGIVKIEPRGLGDYYGFLVDKDHLYLDGEFMTHHNCGKTSMIRTIISNYDFKPVTVQSSSQTNDDTMTEAFEYALEQSPALLYIEDLDSLLGSTVSVSHFLNLLDGVSSKNGILLIATANDLSKLNEAVTDRPSRFDRKILIPLPDLDMTKKYLKHWFGNGLKAADLNKIAKDTVGMNFSYAYLKELYLTASYHAISNNRENPTLKDAQAALDQLLRDKQRALSGYDDVDAHEEIGIL